MADWLESANKRHASGAALSHSETPQRRFWLPPMHDGEPEHEPRIKMKQIDMINFTKNMALIGALLMFLLLPHPWPMSLGIG